MQLTIGVGVRKSGTPEGTEPAYTFRPCSRTLRAADYRLTKEANRERGRLTQTGKLRREEVRRRTLEVRRR